jgi:hypothetical protein
MLDNHVDTSLKLNFYIICMENNHEQKLKSILLTDPA